MREFFRDLRHSIRTLGRDPGFTAVAVLTLALGIGANTAIFSIVNTVLLRPLAYRDPGRLFVIQETVERFRHLYPVLPANAHHFVTWRERNKSFDGMAAMVPTEFNLTGAGEPERIAALRVSANFLALLGVQPQRGRNFLDEEDRAGRDSTVIITDSLWKRHFQSDPALIGKRITMDGARLLVVGILPPSFQMFKLGGLGAISGKTEVLIPLALTPRELASTGDFDYRTIARLKNGVSPEKAVAELNVFEADIGRQQDEQFTASMVPLLDQVVGPVRRGLIVILAAIGAVLLIVCVNLANLLLARSSSRARESAIRAALGASRAALVRRMLSDSLVLSLAGGALGVFAAAYGLQALVRSAPVDLPRLDEVRLDTTVLLFALALSIATALIFGILPAWRLSGIDPQEALKSGSRSVTEGRKGRRVRGLLVSLEVGLSTVLLITAGLLIGSFYRLINVNKGFEASRLVTLQLGLPSAKYTTPVQRANFFERALDKVRSTPGITAAGLSTILPLQGEAHVNGIVLEGSPQPPGQTLLANYRFVTPGYFPALQIALRRGRLFEDADLERRVALVSERTAERLWPGQDPIGRRFRPGEQRPPFEVVGVVGDVRGISLMKEPGLMIYMPFTMPFNPRGALDASLIVRTAMDPRAIAPALRNAVWSVDADVPIPPLKTMDQIVSGSVAGRRFQMSLLASFAAAALLLASLGIYGVVSYSVSQRTNEMGIRVALGARSADVYRLILSQGLAPVWIGLAAGVAGALALGRTLSSLLFEVRATDPAIITAVVVLLAAVAALACYVPARRATGVDPLTALRYE